MKKKAAWTLLALSLSFILAACQPKATQEKQASTTTSNTSINSQVNIGSPNDGIATSTSPSESHVINQPDKQAATILQTLSQTFPSSPLPQKILTATDSHFLSAATTKEESQWAINYYAEEQAIPFNNAQLNDLDPIARFTKTTYATEDEAQGAVNYVPVETSGQPVDLGHQITGYQDAGAGSVFLSWQEGNWSLNIHGINLDGEDPLPLAKELVELLEEEALPAPKIKGQINLRVSNTDKQLSANTVTWQEGDVVYVIEHHDARQAIHMALSLI